MTGEAVDGAERDASASALRRIHRRYRIMLAASAITLVATVAVVTVAERSGVEQRRRQQAVSALQEVDARLRSQVREAISHVRFIASSVTRGLVTPATVDPRPVEAFRAALATAPTGLPTEAMTDSDLERYGAAFLRDNRVLDTDDFRASTAFLSFARTVRSGSENLRWSYVYDAQARFTTIYPAAPLSEIVGTSVTPTAGVVLDTVFGAGGSLPLRQLSPEQNPDRTLKFSRPYLDAAGSGLLVSLLQPIDQSGRFVAVAGTDINLVTLDRLTADHGAVLERVAVIDGEGRVVADSRSRPRLDAVPTVDAAFPEATRLAESVTAVGVDSPVGEQGVMWMPIEGTPWRLVARINEGHRIDGQGNWMALAAGGIAVLLLLLWTHWRVGRPAIVLVGALADADADDDADGIDPDDPQPVQLPAMWASAWRHHAVRARQRAEERRRQEAATRRLEELLESTQFELVRSERQASLVSLMSVVAAELTTPLGNTDLLLDAVRSRAVDEQGGEDGLRRLINDGVDLALAENRRAGSLVARMRAIAGDATREEPRTFAVATAIADAVWVTDSRVQSAGLTLEVHAPDDLTVHGPPGALTQAFVAVVSNCVRHAFPNGGPGRVLVTATPTDDSEILIEVTDNGVGMSESRRQGVFDSLFTGSVTGAGLHLVRDIIEAGFAGTISLHSETGRGTTVAIRLPHHPTPDHQPAADHHPAPDPVSTQ